MDVIGAGFGRTGTLSLKTALERLGFGPCHHMFEVIGEAKAARRWLAAADQPPDDWSPLLGGYRSITDWPSCFFWRELSVKYPEAKVVLTLRDPESWYESMQRMMNAATDGVSKAIIAAGTMPPASLIYVASMMDRLVWNGTFQGRIDDRAYAIAKFEQHTEEVLAKISADRLLVYQVTEGWQPLCQFLGVPVPDEDFPRRNDAQAFTETIAATVAGAGAPGGRGAEGAGGC